MKMAVRHSRENLTDILSEQDAICNICDQPLSQADLTAVSPCKHKFHYPCITESLRESNHCPTCKRLCTFNQLALSNNNLQAELSAADQLVDIATHEEASENSSTGNRGRGRTSRISNAVQRRGMVTRSQQRSQLAPLPNICASEASVSHEAPKAQSVEDINQIIQAAMQRQQQQLMQDLTALIQGQLSTRQVDSNSHHSGRERVFTPPGEPVFIADRNQNTSSSSGHINNQYNGNARRPNASVLPDKVPNIIQSWRIKFDAARDGLQTDEFLYRVRALAQQNLNGDYQLLCDHLHLFFGGKAVEWYWRFHRACPQFTWDEFCREFRKKFDDIDTDMDIWEAINSRRQGDKETFEEYQFQVERLVSRLKTIISEESLVRLLIRHSKPHLRYELMHLGINTLARLREAIRTHEQFSKQVKPLSVKNIFPQRSTVSQLDNGSDAEELDEVSALQHKQMKCWNCAKSGHRFEDCLEARIIFCYGCGMKNTYKPNCPTCNPSENRRRDASANKNLSHPNH
ncbi:uncharacterized protein LOC115769252 [Drosophila novamexicana]|uniref:uncharacterized protein LOC115758982 n=1 Tax=Drosophila novamexicana TaxID=47314 RepID=UPI0011E5912A|nr:uncharacterized protein LOC115758982 [Drosophila novamexicana]XP_030555777.1 uncharacterized protein LOC115759085 [Drosophila novamexicana]XP_030569824.1 uncharacterized protein LOC115769252 [Drosophila novamexicana]